MFPWFEAQQGRSCRPRQLEQGCPRGPAGLRPQAPGRRRTRRRASPAPPPHAAAPAPAAAGKACRSQRGLGSGICRSRARSAGRQRSQLHLGHIGCGRSIPIITRGGEGRSPSCRNSCARSCSGTIWRRCRKRPSVHRQRQVRPASIEPGTRPRVPSSEQGRSDPASGPMGGSREVYVMKTQTRFWITRFSGQPGGRRRLQDGDTSHVGYAGPRRLSRPYPHPRRRHLRPRPRPHRLHPRRRVRPAAAPARRSLRSRASRGAREQTQESPFPEQEQQQSGSSGGSTSSPSKPV